MCRRGRKAAQLPPPPQRAVECMKGFFLKRRLFVRECSGINTHRMQIKYYTFGLNNIFVGYIPTYL